ncbi:MAG: glycosyltransferase [Methanobacteriaceae archaeon]|nr:glycosyltransferase [Methanobacteriaceae archaeon]
MIKDSFEYEKGISAIIPTYKGEKYILKLLESLKNQTLDYNLFEAIIIINGEEDNTQKIIEEFKLENPYLNINLDFSELGVSNARNHAISIVKKEYTTFIDDDDYISPNFLEKLYKYSKPNRVVIGTFLDVKEDSSDIKESYLSPPLLKKTGIIENPYSYMKDILVITTDKSIPTKAIKTVKFNPKLKNGVDISYFSKLYSKYDFEFYIIDKYEEAIYYRLWRDNSISRQSLSYEFNITGRLNVINDINQEFENTDNPQKIQFLKELTVGQVYKINKYLDKNPDELKRVSKDINSYNFKFFPYKYFNTDFKNLNNFNNELIISYAFPPTNTTTSNVIAKRILKNENNVDIICGSLDNLDKDYDLENLLDEFILEKIVIDLSFSSDWLNIKQFIEKGIEKINKKYDKIYSRSYFQHSHFLALEYKLKNNSDVFWSAEFSDPTIYNFKGDKNTPPINDNEYIEKVNSYLPDKLDKISEDDSLNFICEYLTYVFADEILFTNENQKEVMLGFFSDDIKEIVNKKSKISKHPTLDEKYYYIKENNSYEIDDSYINFAYFGVIFSNRTLEDFVNAFDNLDLSLKDKFRLHIFTPNITMFEQLLSPELFEKTRLNPTVSFLEFLNLSTKFDCLIVNDSYTKDSYKINPFLPSKISDYIGSGQDIWAICEENSPMYKMDIQYKSLINDMSFNEYILTNILLDKLNLNKNILKDQKKYSLYESIFKERNVKNLKLLNENKDKQIKYLQKRSVDFSTKIDELIQVLENEFKKNNENLEKITHLEIENKNLKNKNEKILNSKTWKLINKFKK